MHPTTRTVSVDDIDISCTVVGDDTPLVVLHGAIGLGSTYMRALDSWADHVQVIHYDQRGSGHTPVGDVSKVSMAGGVADLDGLRRALGLDRIQVLGHSAGAYLAALYAATHPEATIAAVLLNPGPPLHPELMARFGAKMAGRRTPADKEARHMIEASDAFSAGRPEALEAHQLNTFIPFFRDRAAVDSVSLGFTEITAANIQHGAERMMGSLGQLDPMARFATIECPTLVVHSELDAIPIEWNKMLAETIPNAEFTLIDGGSHFPMVEDAEQLRNAVVPWLRSSMAASPT